MKNLILTLAIVALSVLAFGQKKPKENLLYTGSVLWEGLIIQSDDNVNDPKFMTERCTIFNDAKNEPILIFKDNGDIIYKGKKLVTDTAIVNGLKKAFTGERRVR